MKHLIFLLMLMIAAGLLGAVVFLDLSTLACIGLSLTSVWIIYLVFNAYYDE